MSESNIPIGSDRHLLREVANIMGWTRVDSNSVCDSFARSESDLMHLAIQYQRDNEHKFRQANVHSDVGQHAVWYEVALTIEILRGNGGRLN